MRPITIFRPYEDEVRAIVPLPPPSNNRNSLHLTQHQDSISGSDSLEDVREATGQDVVGPPPLLATIGKGYRNLLGRYAPLPKSVQSDPAQQRSMYCLLWRAHNWINS